PALVAPTTLIELARHLLANRLRDAIPNETDHYDHEEDRREDAHREANAEQGMLGLRRVGLITIAGQQPASDRAAEAEPRLEREEDRGEHHAGRATAGLPLRIVGGVGKHRPEKWYRRRIGDGAYQLEPVSGANGIGRHDDERREEDRR